MYSRIIILLFVCLSTSCWSQIFLPKEVMASYQDGILNVRWEPGNYEEWLHSKNQGYDIVIEDISEGVLREDAKEFNIKPLPYKEWDHVMGDKSPFIRKFYTGCLNFLYSEEVGDDGYSIEDEIKGLSEKELDEFKLGLLLYSATYDVDLIRHIGLGLNVKVKQGHNYRISIQCQGHKAKTLTVMAAENEAQVPQIKAKWSDRLVNLRWNTKPSSHVYFGYHLERSRDGLSFSRKDSLPYVNNLERFSESDQQSDLVKIDSLEENYVNYYYRIKGFDYFGRTSKGSSLVFGYGFEQLDLSPYIYFADQTEANEAHIKWRMPESKTHLVEYYRVMRADSLKGKYDIDSTNISKYSAEIKLPIENKVNYYRLEAIPKDGEEVTSMPVLVMGQDHDPPEAPKLIDAFIDSLDNAQIIWHRNQEEDLWGYRIFKSNFENDEFSPLNAHPFLDTIYVDSIDIDLGNKKVYYTIRAFDRRNNGSIHSDTIELRVPDKVAPFSPFIAKLEQKNDSIIVEYNKSVSDDVAEYMIYRRDIGSEKDWREMIVISVKDADGKHIDKDFSFEKRYAYTIVARDSTGLESTPEHFMEIGTLTPEIEFMPEIDISYEINEEDKVVNLSWQFNNMDLYKSALIYKGYDSKRLTRHTTINAPKMNLRDTLEPNRTVYYKIEPSFKGQKRPYFSELIIIEARQKK